MLASIATEGSTPNETPTWLAVGQVGIIFAFALIPIAIGFAILRHGLYEIDLIIRKTVRYAVLVASLLAIVAAGDGPSDRA